MRRAHFGMCGGAKLRVADTLNARKGQQQGRPRLRRRCALALTWHAGLVPPDAHVADAAARLAQHLHRITADAGAQAGGVAGVLCGDVHVKGGWGGFAGRRGGGGLA